MKRISISSATLGAELLEALRTDGFFYLCDLPVDTQAVLDEAKEFFNSPTRFEHEMKQFRGWTGLGAEVTSYEDGQKRRDWHETWDYIPPVDDESSPLKGRIEFLSKRQSEFYDVANRIGFIVIRALEKEMGLTEGSIIDGTPFSLLRMLHYPLNNQEHGKDAVNSELEVGIGIGPHTDYGFLTFVLSDVTGLEVFRNNDWHKSDASAKMWVCNIGDSLSAMTGGVLKATRHRVVVSEARTSVAFFFEPPLNKIVTALKSDFLDKNRNKSEKISDFLYSDFLTLKYKQSFPQMK